MAIKTASTKTHSRKSNKVLPAEAEPAILELEQFLPYRLSVLSNRISSAIAAVYAGRFGIGVTEWRTLAILGRYPGVSANTVAERAAMDKVAVSRAVSSLLDKGLLDRSMDSEDRRRSVLRLSKAGLRLHADVAPAALQIERTLMDALGANDRQQLDTLLSRLEDGLAKL